MAQTYKVTQAFQCTVSKEDKTPKTVTFNGHTFNAWKIKIEDQEDHGVEGNVWININKKPGNEIKVGDELYGDIKAIEGKFGTFYNFKSESRPLGELPVAKAQVEDSDNLVNEKLDYIIEQLDRLLATEDEKKVNEVIPGAKKVALSDLDI